MNLLLNLDCAARSLVANLLRSALTILGIAIGVSSVVLLVAIGQGVKNDVTRQVEGLGTDLLIVLPGRLDPSGQPNPIAMAGNSTLLERDVAVIRGVHGVRDCVPISIVAGTVERGTASSFAVVVGATAAIAGVRRARLLSGRFFRPDEENMRLCVLSPKPAQDLFGTKSPVGREISARGEAFTVIGVLRDDEGPSAFSSPADAMRNMVYLPLDAVRAAFGGQISRMLVTTDYRRAPDAVIGDIRRGMLRLRGGREDFGIMTQRQLLSTIYKVLNILTALLAGIAAISLVVAAISIMNIMLVTVTERTREIGLRKAVGARRRDIFTQFLTEAVAMSFVGGALGIVASGVTCQVIRHATALHPVITLDAVLLAFGVCFLVGLVAGVSPAMRAARCSPIDALRYE